MASSLQNLSEHILSSDHILLEEVRIAIVKTDWNKEIIEALFDGAYSTLVKHGVSKKHIHVLNVPGAYELPLAAQRMAQQPFDAVICLGCVIQGDTPHFDYISAACAQGIMEVGLKFDKPVVFGVLTTLNPQQALDRAGGKHGNKGDEAAMTALNMLGLKSKVVE